MTEQFNRIEDKIDKVHDRIAIMDARLAALGFHVDALAKRTSAAESELEPLKRHAAMWSGAAKLVGILSVLVGIGAGVHQFLK